MTDDPTAPAGIAGYLAPRASLCLRSAIATAAFVACLFVLLYHAPVAYVAVITENRWGENATFFAYVVTATILTALAWNRTAPLQHGILAVIALVCLLIAMEEISWGMWIHKIGPPDWLARRNVQNELNFHNLEGVAEYKTLSRTIVAAGLAAWVAVSAVVVHYRTAPWSRRFARLVPLLPPHIAPTALVVSWLMVSNAFIKAEEIAELALALLALLWASDLYAYFGSKPRTWAGRLVRSRATGVIAASVLTVPFSMAADRFFPDAVSGRLTRTAARDYPDRGMIDQSRQVFDYLFRNPEYFSSGTLDEYDEVIIGRDAPSQTPITLLRPGELAAFYTDR